MRQERTMENVSRIIRACASVCVILSLFGCAALFSSRPTTKLEDIIAPGTEAVLEYDGADGTPELHMTEGASWMDGKLYFTNINFHLPPDYAGSGMWMLEPGGECKISKENVFLVGTCPLGNGNLAVCYLTSEGDGSIIGYIAEMTTGSEIVRIIAEFCDGIPFGVPNDLWVDSKGGIYFTDALSGSKYGRNKKGTAFYYISAGGKVSRLTEWNEHDFPNGCVVSADGSKFFLDDNSDTVWVFDIKPDGTLANKRPFAKLVMPEPAGDGKPVVSHADGMALDRAGNLYVTSAMGLQIFNRDGVPLGIFNFPKRASNLAFGGDDLSILYATCRDRIYSIQTKMKGYQYPVK